MVQIPEKGFFENFYIWFDFENKKEYYSTPLYQYQTISKGHFTEGKQNIKLEKSISKIKPSKKNEALKYPAFILFPYEENIGYMLIKFLNADFSSFETAYDTFFYAYGFELLQEYGTCKSLKNRFDTEEQMLEACKSIYKNVYYDLKDAQYNFRKCVDFIYNLGEKIELEDSKYISKFIACVIKKKYDIYSYAKDIDVVLDNYIDVYYDYGSETIESLVKKLDENIHFVKRKNIYTSPHLFSVIFLILEQLTSIDNLQIKKCQNCGRYFIPVYRLNEIYCDLENVDNSPVCRDIGASETYKKTLESSPALLEYRRTYQKKIMIVSRNKEDVKLKESFDKWKKEAQGKIKLYKNGKISHEELYKWIMENK